MTLVEAIYQLTATLPDSERFGLVTQMRRSAVSIPSNIAEGAARQSTTEYLRFLAIARGSIAELDTQIRITQRLGFCAGTPALDEIVNRTFARLNALMQSLKKRSDAPGFSESPIPKPQSRHIHAR